MTFKTTTKGYGKVKNQQDFLNNLKNLKMKRKNEPVRGFKPAQKVLWTTFVCSMLMFLANAKTDLNRTLAPMDSNLIGVELQTQISGSITDADGVPLPGANIVEKGTSNGVTADFDGNFTIEVANEMQLLWCLI